MKLIRNKIPDLISDKSKITQIETDKDFLEALGMKICEEGLELKYAISSKDADSILEEAGDCFEVLMTVIGELDLTLKDLQEQADVKADELGSFSQGYQLN